MDFIASFTTFFMDVFGPLLLLVLVLMLGGALVIAVYWIIADALQLPGRG